MWAKLSGLVRHQSKPCFNLATLKACHEELLNFCALELHTPGECVRLIETLRLISETLIWGDQHDQTVFDYFLEKNMLSHFKKILNQKGNVFVKVQMLQSLNILFENIHHESSIYYLLSNNHINQIITCKFDFSNEEILAYYISFLKTLSFQLSPSTIYFFLNKGDFPLYTEAVKFFNHRESMVRIAVRTITLNICRVDDDEVRALVCNESVAPYFSNLVWFIGNQSIELDQCAQAADCQSSGYLAGLFAEHVDHLHYLNDMYDLGREYLSVRLTVHLLDHLLVPLYVCSLLPPVNIPSDNQEPRITQVTALLLLNQIFSIFTYQPLLSALATELLKGEALPLLHLLNSLSKVEGVNQSQLLGKGENIGEATDQEPKKLHFDFSSENSGSISSITPANILISTTPEVNVDQENQSVEPDKEQSDHKETVAVTVSLKANRLLVPVSHPLAQKSKSDPCLVQQSRRIRRFAQPPLFLESPEAQPRTTYQFRPSHRSHGSTLQFSRQKSSDQDPSMTPTMFSGTPNENRTREALFRALDCTNGDHRALPAMCLIYTLIRNPGVDDRLLQSVRMYPQRLVKSKLSKDIPQEEPRDMISPNNNPPSHREEERRTIGPTTPITYNSQIVDRTLSALAVASKADGNCRLITLDMAGLLLKELCYFDGTEACLKSRHLQKLIDLGEFTKSQLRSYYTTINQQTFIDTFEYVYSKTKALNMPALMRDWSLLLAPADTPLTDVPLYRRLTKGINEHLERALHAFFVVRRLVLLFKREKDSSLPFSTQCPAKDLMGKSMVPGKYLRKRDLVPCRVVTGEPKGTAYYLLEDLTYFLLVSADKAAPGSGIVHVAHELERVTVIVDFGDPRKLHVRLDTPAIGTFNDTSENLQLVFDDYARAARA
eukprot:Ihof_evm3s82 gene=Ihof_evmTU3s82